MVADCFAGWRFGCNFALMVLDSIACIEADTAFAPSSFAAEKDSGEWT